MSKLDEAKVIVQKYHEDRDTWRAAKAQKLTEAETAVKDAQARLDANAQSDDFDAYQKAKKNLKEAAARLEYCKKQFEGAYITDEKYNELVTGIHAEADTLNETAEATLKSILAQLVELDGPLRATLNEMDQVLFELQSGVYDYKDQPGARVFAPLKGNSASLKDKDYLVLWFVRDVIERAKTAGYLEND